LWHLNMSSGRTMASVTVGLLASAYLLFEREDRSLVSGGGAADS
jgi:hypothetical protein